MKIGNLHQHHDKLESFSAFASRTQSTFTLQKTHAFLNYAEFPAVFADFFKKILSLLLLPRETIASVMIYEEFFKSIHALDAERYAALKAIFAARGRPQILERRKIYVICDWESVVRFGGVFLKLILILSLNKGRKTRSVPKISINDKTRR